MLELKAYYNENEPFAAKWLRNLIDKGLIAPGDVDDRSIEDVQASDLDGYCQCHFFAGIGGWSYALRLAGWPDDRPVWTGSCPCQPFSTAGKHRGTDDDRHLWPEFVRLIGQCKPPTVFGEQVGGASGFKWLVAVCVDVEVLGYAFGSASLPACATGSPHERQRFFFVAHTPGDGCQGFLAGTAAQVQKNGTPETLGAWHSSSNPFTNWKEQLGQTRVDRLADGVSSTLVVRPSLRCFGNAIVPQVAAEFIAAYMECINA